MGENCYTVILFYKKKSYSISLISFNETNCEKVEPPLAEFIVKFIKEKKDLIYV